MVCLTSGYGQEKIEKEEKKRGAHEKQAKDKR
jgi:hypothetical protein